jgi:4-phospho-D-threonate 3-dehydrogenase / 4-phospho-D-erythronate 3-dehydrogenase
MDASSRPLLAISMGDPAGIGPEVIVKALRDEAVFGWCRPLIVGDARILARVQGLVTGEPLPIEQVRDPHAGRYAPGSLPLLDMQNADPRDCPLGRVGVAAGRAAVEYVLKGVELALAHQVDALVTAPLNKEAMNLAGFPYAGHTELLAEKCGAQKVSMLLTSPRLRVVHVSTHVSLREAIERVTPERVGAVIDLAQEALGLLGVARPRIAVAGLNPHASEGGLFGDEEERCIVPAIRAAQARGLAVSGPWPPDTVFLRAANGGFDVVVAMYHDQGHVPMKLLGFDSGVNVSIGLPIIRTSVDHGTAFDIATQGIARPESMLEALRVAAQMVRARR